VETTEDLRVIGPREIGLKAKKISILN